jgi:nicotinate phosphoribosyltransferase
MKQKKERDIAEGILYTDQYQLTMAQLYYRVGIHERWAQFDHFFRSYPDYGLHQAGYCINAGLEWLVEWMQGRRFTKEDISLLEGQTGRNGKPIFGGDFLDWLHKYGNFDGITMRAIPEGRVVHSNVPLTVVQGPLAMAQILETSLLNHLNYQTLIATKACRMDEAGRGQPLLEFGLRRGPDRGANAGARAALIGGADFTSNVGISHVLGYPPKGTHAHSMVQVFMSLGGSEYDAFRAYADVYPDDCLLLVDTIDTLESGIPNAIRVFEELRRNGHQPVGIRLDSGDLAYLSIQAAKLLNEAGFPETAIVLSNQLDELAIWQIITQIEHEAPLYEVDADDLIGRLIYGVGTRLITSKGNSALDGVYKLVAMQDQGEWMPAIKISESAKKTPNPGHKHVWRVYDQRNKAIVDLLSLDDEDPRQMEQIALHHPSKHTSFRTLGKEAISEIEALLITVLEEGELAYEFPSIEEIRERRQTDVSQLDPGVRRLMNPHIYHVSLTERLWQLKQDSIESARSEVMAESAF